MSAKLHKVEAPDGRKKKRVIDGSRRSAPRLESPCKRSNHLEPDPECDSAQGSTEPPVDPPK